MKIVLGVGLVIGSSVWYGRVFQILWGWFAVPTFHVPALTIPQALGLALVARMLVYSYQPAQTDDRAFWTAAIAGYIWPLFALGLGWIYTWFM